MILPFLAYDHDGSPTNFKTRINAGWKRHTFRLGDDWKPGEVIEFAEDMPDGRRIPFQLSSMKAADVWNTRHDDTGKSTLYPCCCAVEPFSMVFVPIGQSDGFHLQFRIGGLMIGDALLGMIAHYDGFDDEYSFLTFFDAYRKRKGVDVLKGQLIHWTRNAYTETTYF